jgi:hypothetical protein
VERRDSGRWEEIDGLFAEALERSESDRSTFLENACCGDHDLELSVRHLLAAVVESEVFWSEARQQRSTLLRFVLTGRHRVDGSS